MTYRFKTISASRGLFCDLKYHVISFSKLHGNAVPRFSQNPNIIQPSVFFKKTVAFLCFSNVTGHTVFSIDYGDKKELNRDKHDNNRKDLSSQPKTP